VTTFSSIHVVLLGLPSGHIETLAAYCHVTTLMILAAILNFGDPRIRFYLGCNRFFQALHPCINKHAEHLTRPNR
jgi:hypothetical protein